MNKERLKAYADLPVRLTVGFHLIYGTQDNVFSWERMLEFKEFLDSFGVPFPVVGAVVSVYTQFICGVLFVLGWKVREAGILMIINFSVAILLVHIGDPYPNVYPALSMLAGGIFMVLNGEGKFSLANLINS